MPRKKLQRYAELATFENVLTTPEHMQGLWRTHIFKNTAPLILELGCGKGEYTNALAMTSPECNFIGVDIKGARLWRGSKNAQEAGLTNVRFLQIYIDHIEEYFGESEVDEIWITFPDPYPLKGDIKKRLTSPRFLARYAKILRPGGLVHLKTDARDLYTYTKEVIAEYTLSLKDDQEDIYIHGTPSGALAIQTYFEKKHLLAKRTISHLAWTLDDFIQKM